MWHVKHKSDEGLLIIQWLTDIRSLKKPALFCFTDLSDDSITDIKVSDCLCSSAYRFSKHCLTISALFKRVLFFVKRHHEFWINRTRNRILAIPQWIKRQKCESSWFDLCIGGKFKVISAPHVNLICLFVCTKLEHSNQPFSYGNISSRTNITHHFFN